MNAKDLVKRIKEDKVNFISLQFTDVMGAVKSVDMPLHNLEGALEDGVWFDGSSVEGFARIQESDMRLVLDPDTYAVLPWSPEDRRRARVFCDIFMPDGEPFEGDPRGTLKRALAKLAERGWTYNIGPEPEFFLFKGSNGHGVHPVPHDVGGYFDFSSFDEAVQVRLTRPDGQVLPPQPLDELGGFRFEGLAAGPSIEKRWGQRAETLPPAHPAWELEAHYIALALAGYIYTLSPQRIILGGGVSQQPQVMKMVWEKVPALLNGYIQSPEILVNIQNYIVNPGLGNQSGVLGALALADQTYHS